MVSNDVVIFLILGMCVGPHRNVQYPPPWYEKAFSLKSYWSYALRVVIFRARLFKAHDAMVSNDVVIFLILGMCVGPHRNVQYPHTIRKNVKTYWSYPLKVVIFRARFFKAHDAMVSNDVVIFLILI